MARGPVVNAIPEGRGHADGWITMTSPPITPWDLQWPRDPW
jgi:hypothetical protein